MRRPFIWMALGALLIPIVARSLWFYRGVYRPPAEVPLPGYAELTIPSPPAGDAEPDAEPSDAGSGAVVVIDLAHGNRFQLPEIQALTDALTRRGARIELILDTFDVNALPLAERLKYASGYLVIAPGRVYSAGEIGSVTRFVDNGGRMLVISDPTRSDPFSSFVGADFGASAVGAVASINRLIEPFGLVFADDHLYNQVENEGNFRNLILRNFAADPLTEGLGQVTFYGARSIHTAEGSPLIMGDDRTFSSLSDQPMQTAVAVRDASGSVLALGDFTFLTSPYYRVADNAHLIEHLADHLLSGSRTLDLANYPYIFRSPVTLLQSESLNLAAETLASVAQLQASLASRGVALNLADELSEGEDAIALGLYDSDDPLLVELLAGFEVTLPGESDDGSVVVEDLGPVRPTGVGLILVQRDEERTLMILVAQTSEDLASLLDIAASGNLAGCLVRTSAAICAVGLGEGFGFGFEQDFFFPEDEFGDLFTPTPVPSP